MHSERARDTTKQPERASNLNVACFIFIILRKCVIFNLVNFSFFLFSISDLSSQHALHLLQSAQSGLANSQSEAPCLSFSQWHFSDFIPPTSQSSNQTFSRLRLCSSFSLAPMLLLSVVSVETVSEWLWGGAFGSPLRPLKDWTAPPSLSSDHWLVGRAY